MTGNVTALLSCRILFAERSDTGTEHAILTGYGRISGSFKDPKVCSGVVGDTGGDGYRPTPRIAFFTDSVRFKGYRGDVIGKGGFTEYAAGDKEVEADEEKVLNATYSLASGDSTETFP